MVATGCLRERPRPRLGGGEAGSTRRAFPFSAAENLLDRAMKKKEKQRGMTWKGVRRSVLIAGEGQPSAPTIAGNHDPLCMQGLVQSVQLPRRHGEVETPTWPVTQAMTTKGARRVPARTVSSFPLWCKGGKRSCGVLRHQAKVAISVQQDQDQEDCKTEVIVEPKTASPPELCAGEDYFCQDSWY